MQYIEQPIDYGALEPITIDGHAAYKGQTADYNILMFEKDGILYTLTCKHEIDTLIALSKKVF